MKPIAVGECDACPLTDVDLFQVPGSVYKLCVVHYQAELAAIESSRVINSVVASSLKQDKTIELKADIFNAATMSFGELHAAIQNDPSIPSEKKNEVLVNLVQDRISQFSDVIFNLNEEKVKKENERAGWRQATVDFIAKLRVEEREKYKKFDISYAPPVATTKTVKAAASGKTSTGRARKSTGFSAAEMVELKAMSAKYEVPMASVQMIVKSQNVSIEAAAKQMASLLAQAKK